MRKLTIILSIFFIPFNLFSFSLRYTGEMDFGITGGYGFPQIGNYSLASVKKKSISSSKEITFGLDFNYFVINSLAITTDITFTYNDLKLGEDSSELYFTDIDLTARYYWFEYIYIGLGLYGRIPVHKPISDNILLSSSSSTVFGTIIDAGVDMKFADSFGIQIGIRSHIPFNAYKGNGYSIHSYPVNFVFGLNFCL